MPEENKLSLIADVAASYLRQNPVGIDQIGAVMKNITAALRAASQQLEGGAEQQVDTGAAISPNSDDKPTPAVSIRSSVKPDAITCLECGVKARTLKRHLMTAHGQTPDQYKAKWGLKKDYPMVAPSYSAKRSEMAKQLGLGQKRPAGRKNGRRKKAQAQE